MTLLASHSNQCTIWRYSHVSNGQRTSDQDLVESVRLERILTHRSILGTGDEEVILRTKSISLR